MRKTRAATATAIALLLSMGVGSTQLRAQGGGGGSVTLLEGAVCGVKMVFKLVESGSVQQATMTLLVCLGQAAQD